MFSEAPAGLVARARLRSVIGNLCLALAGLMTLALLWGGAQPGAVNAVPSPYDQVAHFVCFGIMGFLYVAGLPKCPSWLVAAMVIGIGGVDELRQIVLPGRHASWLDFAMDLAGVVSALLLYVVFARMAGNARARAR